MVNKKLISKSTRWIVRGMPLFAILGASLLPLPKINTHFLMLITLLWLQAFVIFECYFVER